MIVTTALILKGDRYAKLGGILFLIFDIILIISAIKNINYLLPF